MGGMDMRRFYHNLGNIQRGQDRFHILRDHAYLLVHLSWVGAPVERLKKGHFGDCVSLGGNELTAVFDRTTL